jgi:hypothetical protein
VDARSAPTARRWRSSCPPTTRRWGSSRPFTGAARALVVWGAFNLIQLGIAVWAFRLDREPLGPLWSLPLQQFVYRQLIYLVIIESSVSALRGVGSGWRHLPRRGNVVVRASD